MVRRGAGGDGVGKEEPVGDLERGGGGGRCNNQQSNEVDCKKNEGMPREGQIIRSKIY